MIRNGMQTQRTNASNSRLIKAKTQNLCLRVLMTQAIMIKSGSVLLIVQRSLRIYSKERGRKFNNAIHDDA